MEGELRRAELGLIKIRFLHGAEMRHICRPAVNPGICCQERGGGSTERAGWSTERGGWSL